MSGLYLECYEAFARQSAEVVEFLQRYPEQDGGYTTGVCHGDVNQHNILFTSDGPALIQMEHAHVGAQITDVGKFLRKILEKNDWNRRLGMELIRRILPDTSAERTGSAGTVLPARISGKILEDRESLLL
ncbi:MAG: phosphotransferase [Eubacterium ramulus]